MNSQTLVRPARDRNMTLFSLTPLAHMPSPLGGEGKIRLQRRVHPDFHPARIIKKGKMFQVAMRKARRAMTDRFLALIAIGIFIVYTAFSAHARPGGADTAAATACPDGEIWDQGQNKCVPIPRGSHDGSLEAN